MNVKLVKRKKEKGSWSSMVPMSSLASCLLEYANPYKSKSQASGIFQPFLQAFRVFAILKVVSFVLWWHS
jgi:hypothetical protein